MGAGARIGPFARLRPGAKLGSDVHVGKFRRGEGYVEMGAGAKANHLAYLGDGSVGEKANIGAGTIFCNYDGFNKSSTEIGAEAFVGSNSSLVAPVKIGAGAYIGSGSVIPRMSRPVASPWSAPRKRSGHGMGREIQDHDVAEEGASQGQ